MKIKRVKAREVLDSRGDLTVEVELTIDKGRVRAIVPSGASVGEHEAVAVGVQKAIKNVGLIALEIAGTDCTKQKEIDNKMIEMDGTSNKSKLGANAILGVSMAVCKAGALAEGIPLYKYIASLAGNKKLRLPVPSLNVINGGAHAGNNLDIQEYMILPIGALSFKEAIKYGSEVYHCLEKIIEKKYGRGAIHVGDEGGFAPPLDDVEEPLKLLEEAIEKTGYKNKIKIGLDVAASELYKNGKYKLEGKKISSEKLIEIYKKLIDKYNLISIEDPFDEDDWKSYIKLTKQVGGRVQIVGDDLLVTNPKRIKDAIKKKACNALLLKVNQIGTVSEAIEAANLAKRAKWRVMISHRSGETEDVFIADLAVGLGTRQIKSGAPARGERTAKYNQLIRIEEEVGKVYVGKDF